MIEKTYKVTINQSVEAQASNEEKARMYVENILNLIDWGDVIVEVVTGEN